MRNESKLFELILMAKLFVLGIWALICPEWWFPPRTKKTYVIYSGGKSCISKRFGWVIDAYYGEVRYIDVWAQIFVLTRCARGIVHDGGAWSRDRGICGLIL